jgi:LysR family hydrogen peroxide-inducible transcriptional activator
MQIKQAEKTLGIQLFDRDKNPISLTKTGKLLVDQMKIAMQELLKVKEMAKTLNTRMGGELNLGIIPSVAPYLIPLFLDLFLSKYPDISLRIQELKTEELLTSLLDDQLDLGIIATDTFRKELTEKILYEEAFYIFASDQHPYLKKKEIHIEELETHDLWLMSEGHCFKDQVLALCKKKINLKSHIYQSGSLETLIRIISKHSGYTLIPEMLKNTLSDQEIKRHVRKFKRPVPNRKIRVVTRKNHFKIKLIEALINTIQVAQGSSFSI